MNDPMQTTRRRFLKIGTTALVALPVVGFSGRVLAAQNAKVRESLAYQDTPKDDKSCANCKIYLPQTKGCTSIPDDNEIEPYAYCTAWVARDK